MNTGNNPPISPSDPIRIAHYRIVRKIGQGGMSIVYEGMDEKLKRPIAIKILHPFLAEAAEYRARFFREAEAVARLAHPNIVQIFDVSSTEASNEQLYIVTELLVGETLRDFVKRLTLADLPELSAMIVWQIAHALEHAHQKGIIHRDIKPENIMICRDGQIKLMDFGIASLGSEESLTQSGTLLGSLAHLSPEVIRGQKATIASDIFSLTTVFFWMLTGELPFSGNSPHALLKAIVDSPHKKVQCLSSSISDDLALVIERGMKKEPSARFKTSLAMCEAIESALRKMGVTIDIKQMQAVLKDPDAKLPQFKATITEQIKKQIEIYQNANNDTAALALLCRLDANLSPKPGDEQKKKISVIRVASYSALVFGAAIFVGSVWRFFSSAPNESTSSPKAIGENALLKETDEQALPPLFPAADLAKENEIAAHQEEPVGKTPDRAPGPTRLQDLEIIIWPFADVTINGKAIAKDKKSIQVKLEQGIHKLAFTHSYAATVEKTVKVTDIGEPIELNVALIKSKPAFLVVKSDVDGDVAIDGSYKGSAKKSVSHPIVIPMPDKTHAQMKEVIVQHDGYEPFILKTEFIAGQTKHIDVQLIPLAKTKTQAIDDHMKATIKRRYL